MYGERVNFWRIVADWRAGVERHWRLLVLAGLALGALDAVVAALLGDKATMPLNIVNVVVTFLVLRELLRREHLVEREGAFGSYFGASFLAGLGMLVGLVLLIVPGLYLLARWSLAPAMTVARGQRAVEALKSSWHATRDSAWSIVGVYVAGMVIALIGIMAVLVPVGLAEGTKLGPIANFVGAAVIDLASMLATALTVTLYRVLAGAERELDEVFG